CDLSRDNRVADYAHYHHIGEDCRSSHDSINTVNSASPSTPRDVLLEYSYLPSRNASCSSMGPGSMYPNPALHGVLIHAQHHHEQHYAASQEHEVPQIPASAPPVVTTTVTASGTKRYCRYDNTVGCEMTSGHASRHSKIHREKCIQCAFAGCPTMFTRADNMKQHLKTHPSSSSTGSSFHHALRKNASASAVAMRRETRGLTHDMVRLQARQMQEVNTKDQLAVDMPPLTSEQQAELSSERNASSSITNYAIGVVPTSVGISNSTGVETFGCEPSKDPTSTYVDLRRNHHLQADQLLHNALNRGFYRDDLASLRTLPKVRNLEFRTLQLPNLGKSSNRKAAVAYMVGKPVQAPCTRCTGGCGPFPESPTFPIPKFDPRPLPEDWAMRGLPFTKDYFPNAWFAEKNAEPDMHYIETESMSSQHRPERVLWPAIEISRLAGDWMGYGGAELFFVGEKAKDCAYEEGRARPVAGGSATEAEEDNSDCTS
ncbi:hypothetical protein V502_06722, partial [Pseudogymnoascus sp. VKM F-4520 (FW-2644)]